MRPVTEVEQILMERDGMSSKEAYDALQEARQRVMEGENPEVVLQEEFGLEPDYIFDLIP